MKKWPLCLLLAITFGLFILNIPVSINAEEPQKPLYNLDELLQVVDEAKAKMPAKVQPRDVSATPEPLGSLWGYAGPLNYKTIWDHAVAQVDQTPAKDIPHRLKLIEAVMEADIYQIVKAQKNRELAFTITWTTSGKGFYGLAPGMFDPDSFQGEPFRSVRNWEEVQQNLKDFYELIRASWSDSKATQRVFDPPGKRYSFGWRYANFLGLIGGGHPFPPMGTPTVVASPSTTTTVTGTPVAGTKTPGTTPTLTPTPITTIPVSCQEAAPDCQAYIRTLQQELAKERGRATKNLWVFWWVVPSLAFLVWGVVQMEQETGDKTKGFIKILLSVISLVIAGLWYFNVINFSRILRIGG